jgi:hypothetical protein
MATHNVRPIYDGLRVAVRAIGGPADVGMAIGGKDDPEDAEQWVNDRLNPNRRERFSIADLVAILFQARAAGCHDAMHALYKACGYTAPRSIDQRGRDVFAGDNAIPKLLAEMLEELRDIRSDSQRLVESVDEFKQAAMGGEPSLREVS